MGKKNFYAVSIGRIPGIYEDWEGEKGAKAQVNGYQGAKYKGFSTRKEAKAWLANALPERVTKKLPSYEEVVMYTDGGCVRNPGPGGYGAVISYNGLREELSGGFRQTTNNRMELLACIAGLQTLRTRSSVTIFSDSKYVVHGITKGWARRWKANGWMRNTTQVAKNADLWDSLLDLCGKHQVKFVWIKGHANNPENVRCDRLAFLEASGDPMTVDSGFEGTGMHGWFWE
jgi:ribonuclease HI